MRNRKDVSLAAEQRRLSRIGGFANAALAGLRKWSDWLAGFPAAPRHSSEPLEARQLLSTAPFSVSIAAPPTATIGQQFYVYVWTADGTVSGDYAVDPGGGGGGIQYAAPSTTSRVTPIPITYVSGSSGSHTITVTATDTLDATSCQTCGMDDLGSYPATSGGPTTFVPSGAGTATPSSIVVDPGTGDTYVAETYHTSSCGNQMALTRLDANDLPDTTWGTYVSGSTYTGTLLVSPFGAGTGSTGTDVAYGAAVEDADISGIGSVDEVAIAGHSTNGMAAAIIDVGGTGSVLGNSDYGSQTMPAGCAFAVTFDDSGDVVLAGTDSNQYNMVAVALYGTTVGTDHAGELDTSFGPSGTGVTTFNFGGTTCTVARAIMQEPDYSDEELILGGWCSAGCGACSTQCNLIVVGLTDGYGSFDRGDLDPNFGLPESGTTHDTGYNDVNVGDTACLAGWNGCYGCAGCNVPSNDSIYSLVWDDEVSPYDFVAVGTTNYSPSYQPVLWGLTQTGQADTTSGSGVTKGFGGLGTNGDGLAVPDIDIYSSTVVAGAVATEISPADGDIYIAGTFEGNSSDLFLARYTVPLNADSGGVYRLDPNFGTSFGSAGAGTGYFQQDLGSATADSSDNGVGVAEGIDGSVVLLGSTNSAGGSTAVIRYNATSAIDVLEGEPSRTMSLAAVQAAATSATPFSAAPAITSDATANDLSPPDGALDPGTTHKRPSARRPAALAASPPPLVSSAPS